MRLARCRIVLAATALTLGMSAAVLAPAGVASASETEYFFAGAIPLGFSSHSYTLNCAANGTGYVAAAEPGFDYKADPKIRQYQLPPGYLITWGVKASVPYKLLTRAVTEVTFDVTGVTIRAGLVFELGLFCTSNINHAMNTRF